MFHITVCPICQNKNFVNLFKCRDHTKSKEWFQLIQCSHCQFTMTSPRPDVNNLGAYYNASNYISHSDTSKGLINKLYKSVRSFTLQLKLNWIQQLVGQGKVIDIGSGAGYFLNTCHKAGYHVIGIEPDEQARAQTYNKFNLICHPESYLDEIKNHDADLITMWHVLEHVPDLVSRLNQIHRILKPSGYAIIAVPNCNSFDAKYYQSHWAGYDVPRHLWHFKPKNMLELASHNGFECIQIKPMVFDAFYVSMLSASYKGTPISFLFGSLIGFISNLVAFFSKEKRYSSQVYVFKKSEKTPV